MSGGRVALDDPINLSKDPIEGRIETTYAIDTFPLIGGLDTAEKHRLLDHRIDHFIVIFPRRRA
jgi:hypothetical protein